MALTLGLKSASQFKSSLFLLLFFCLWIWIHTEPSRQAGAQAVQDGGHDPRLPEHHPWPDRPVGQTRQCENQGPPSQRLHPQGKTDPWPGIMRLHRCSSHCAPSKSRSRASRYILNNQNTVCHIMKRSMHWPFILLLFFKDLGLYLVQFGLFVWFCFSLQVNLCLLQASVEEGSPSCSTKCVTHVSLVALCFDRIATQFRMNR